jgi:hypothetical protein
MVSCAGREGFLEVSEMSVFNFLKQDANLLARIEVLETRVAILEGTLDQLKNGVAVASMGCWQALISRQEGQGFKRRV